MIVKPTKPTKKAKKELTSDQPPKPKRRRRKRGTGKHYFTKDTENAIIAYAETDSVAIRTKLYIEHIQPAFDELVNKIVFTYKFTNLPNISVLREECKVWLTTILDKFNPDNGSKAFSYFSVVTKNWFTHKAKKQAIKNRREVDYDTMTHEIDIVMSDRDNKESEQDEREFWGFLIMEMDDWKELATKENEHKVLEAVELLMKNIDNIEIFNKKAIYLYLREITGLNTKQIVTNLNKMRSKYRDFREKWNDGEII
jgi:hypothetical protein